jgi:hypothetical protein
VAAVAVPSFDAAADDRAFDEPGQLRLGVDAALGRALVTGAGLAKLGRVDAGEANGEAADAQGVAIRRRP